MIEEKGKEIETAVDAVEFYQSIAHLLLDILDGVDNVSVGGSNEYELKLMCVNKLKAIVERIDL
jgi:hypothetical protein